MNILNQYQDLLIAANKFNDLHSLIIRNGFKLYKHLDRFILVTVALDDLSKSLSENTSINLLDKNYNNIENVEYMTDSDMDLILHYRKYCVDWNFPESSNEEKQKYITICNERRGSIE